MANEEILFTINNTWMLVATFLVFLMHLGFATLESGVTQSKNTVNILFKNVSIVAIGILTYALVGFNLMYPGEEFAGAIFGFAGFGIGTDAAGVTSAYNPGYTYWTDFLFQGMFAATAATIVSGAVAERVKLNSFLVFAAVYVAIIYPIAGMWKWGGGWLDAAGFHDFAGSTIVHCVGGWGALVGAIMLGPRLGRFDGKKAIKIDAHNLPLAVIGVFLLWFGWYGFNGGSVLSADPGPVSFVFVTTSLAAAAGVMGAKLTAWAIHRQADLLMIINGALAGLVGITAGADVVSPMAAVVIGAIAGILVVLATMALEKLRIDDPVGAVPVHLVCGIWGTLAVGIFAPEKAFLPQLLGVAAIAAFCATSSFVIFFLIKATLGLRVSEQEELTGLDINEHGTGAYSGVEIVMPHQASAPSGGGALEPAPVAYAPPEV